MFNDKYWAKEGASVEIGCQADGNPAPNINMDGKNGNGLDEDGLQTLTIQHVMTGEEKHILCSLQDYPDVSGMFEYLTHFIILYMYKNIIFKLYNS